MENTRSDSPDGSPSTPAPAWNGQGNDGDPRSVHACFEAQARSTPAAIALIHGARSLSYAQLDAHAGRLARRLTDAGVAPGDRVALCAARGFAAIAGLLAALKAGAAYVPLDPGYPAARLAHVLQDCEPALVLADAAGRAALGEAALAGRRVLDLDEALAASSHTEPGPTAREHDDGMRASADDEDRLAYVIYTSGSTGTPKGVAMPHAPLLNLIRWQAGQTPGPRRTLQYAALGFDVAFQEIFATLCGGAALVLIDEAARLDFPALIAAVDEHRVQRLFLPYLALQALAEALEDTDEARLQSLRGCLTDIIVAGEQLTLTTPIRNLFRRLPECRLHNHYGPTETHVVAAHVLHGDIDTAPAHVPIGRAVANTRLYLLDDAGQPVAPGEPGELHIGGVAVARGYLNRSELTAERFLPDPFDPRPAARMYRTGDLARCLPDGELVFLGRNDQQIKLRGFRVEPGEIEARLREHPALREAVVLARADGTGSQRLIAYVVATADDAADLPATLRDHLLARLPDYMVPSAFVRIDALPLTAHGKLDRDALPAPDDRAFAARDYHAPQGEIETVLAELWRELLGVERVGRDDHFLELGGHSLSAARLLSRLRKRWHRQFPLTALLADPRLSAQATALADAMADTPSALPSIPADHGGWRDSPEQWLPLSFAQRRLWFLSQLDGVSATYHIPLALDLRGPLDREALRKSLNRVFARHDALRSTFVSIEGEPRARLLPADRPMPLSEHDLSAAPDAEAEAERIAADESRAPFDLAEGPLIRSRLLRLREDRHRLLITQHHIVSDGWSMDVLARELGALYSAFVQDRADPLPALPVQYPDYAAWQARWFTQAFLHNQIDYWRRALSGAPVLLELPTDRPRPPRQSFDGAMHPLRIDAALTAALERLGRRHGASLFMLVLSAWALVLSRLSGQDDVVIGAPNAQRDRDEVEPLIGFFVNTAALRIDLSGEPAISELIARARRATLDAQDHQDLPFEQVVEALRPPRRPDHTPLFQAMFAWQGEAPAAFELHGLRATALEPAIDAVKFDLELQLQQRDGALTGGLSYATALFDAQTIERHCGYLIATLAAMAADDTQPAHAIELLSPRERDLLLDDWNRTEAAYPEQACFQALFERQARENPQAAALVHDGESIGYAELNAQANALAHYLIAAGVRPERRVALCARPGPRAIVGLLAVLKAGGAYVPFDPAHSSARLRQMLADAEPLMAIGDEQGRRALGDLNGLASLDLDADRALWRECPVTDPRVPDLRPHHLAYLIYTSGSTGTPKGVMVEHRNMVQFTSSQIARFGVGRDSRIAQFASLSFDASIIDLGLSLGSGAALYLPGEHERGHPDAYLDWIARHGITHSYLPPAFLQGRTELPRFPTRPMLLVGGEAVSPALIETLAEHARVMHVYGPTETTVLATAWEAPPDLRGIERAPIGRPLANTRAYLLDARRRPVPLGATGELYIGGAGVTRGYLNRPELSAERFFADPFSTQSGARMYRSGDLARYLDNGELLFLGRNDHQVKLRGFRIELGEIEARLLEHAAVREAVVIAREDTPGQQRLIAYVVAHETDDDSDGTLAARLRAHLAPLLPDYMVPAAFVSLPALPLTAGGKVERKSLPAPDDAAFAHRRYSPPASDIEVLIAQLWQELLKLERIGRDDDFFELGGHSLLAMRLLGRLQNEFGVTIAPSLLFNRPRLADFADVVLIAALQAEPQA